MIELPQITLVTMTSVDIDGAIMALVHSSKNIKFSKTILISHEKPSNLPNNIDFGFIEKMESVDDYSKNMIYKLGDYINTNYALIIQSDGYVVNANKWRNEFLDYDYIGAPFPFPNDDFSYRNIRGEIFKVGNGGFSLRSKKLIDLPNKLNLEWKSFHGFYNEDGFICAMNRHIYEENGIKFAPVDVAKHFSHESQIPEINGIIPFGFHGKQSKWIREKLKN